MITSAGRDAASFIVPAGPRGGGGFGGIGPPLVKTPQPQFAWQWAEAAGVGPETEYAIERLHSVIEEYTRLLRETDTDLPGVDHSPERIQALQEKRRACQADQDSLWKDDPPLSIAIEKKWPYPQGE